MNPLPFYLALSGIIISTLLIAVGFGAYGAGHDVGERDCWLGKDAISGGYEVSSGQTIEFQIPSNPLNK